MTVSAPAELLRDLRSRGLTAPVLATADGALGFWAALRDVFSETAEQRCWVDWTRFRVFFANRRPRTPPEACRHHHVVTRSHPIGPGIRSEVGLILYIYDEARAIDPATFDASEGPFSGATEGWQAFTSSAVVCVCEVADAEPWQSLR